MIQVETKVIYRRDYDNKDEYLSALYDVLNNGWLNIYVATSIFSNTEYVVLIKEVEAEGKE